MRRERGPYRYRRMQMLEGASDDAYRPGSKPQGTVLCPRCKAVFRKGRWVWGTAPAGAHKRRCPACLRIAEGSPAGYISMTGSFFETHRREVLGRVRHCEDREKSTHPLERIMAIDAVKGGVQVTTTSVHLARRIAHALESAFKGTLNLSYNHQDNLLRVRWSRAAD
jgi:NMD protein affecting ribosome stability and mRNA decay